MLVIVHHWDVEGLLQALLDVEALRSLDVLQVDSAERRGDALHGLAEFLWVLLVDLDVEHIDATINLEKQSFTFHHRLATHGAYVTKT